jgi:hypothetical protein
MFKQLKQQSPIETVSIPAQTSYFFVSGEKCVEAIFELVVTVFGFENSQIK